MIFRTSKRLRRLPFETLFNIEVVLIKVEVSNKAGFNKLRKASLVYWLQISCLSDQYKTHHKEEISKKFFLFQIRDHLVFFFQFFSAKEVSLEQLFNRLISCCIFSVHENNKIY